MDIISILVNRIDLLCRANGITINKMLFDCGLSKDVINNMKKEKPSIPSVDKILKIAQYFSVSVDYLLDNEKKPNAEISADKKRSLELTNIERRLLDAFKIISHDDQLIELGRIERMTEENATPPMAFAARSAGPENTNCRPQIDPAKLEALDDIPTMDEE